MPFTPPPFSSDGILVLDKPAGPSSASFARHVARILGIEKVGHTGTLDPFASGVLPLCFGEATKLSSFLTETNKIYEGTIEFGSATDTYDSQGQVIQTCAVPHTLLLADLETAAQRFRGLINQVPPAFSAKKIDGVASYKLARKGRAVELKANAVEIYEFRLLSWCNPRLEFHIRCSKGTYIRSIAHDLGEHLGFGGHLQRLRRIQHGRFALEQAVTLEAVEKAVSEPELPNFLHQHLIPPSAALAEVPAIHVDQDRLQYIRSGGNLNVPWMQQLLKKQAPEHPMTKVLDSHHNLVALVTAAGEAPHKQFKYLRVFN